MTFPSRCRLSHLAVVVWVAMAALAAQQPAFTPSPEKDEFSQGYGPFVHSAAVGDMNGDRRPDVVVPGPVVLFNRGHQFARAAAAKPSFGIGICLRLGDVDRDGDLDLAQSAGAGQIQLFLNDGKGGLTEVTSTHIPTLSRRAGRGFEFADLDGDRDLDLVSDIGAILINDGLGKFKDESAVRLLDPGLLPGTLATVDLDGDGDLDIVLLNGAHFNDGRGRFKLDKLGFTLRYGERVLVGDVDRDGDLDLISSSGRLLRNDGSGKCKDDPGYLPKPPVNGYSVLALTDLNADRWVDLVVGNQVGNDVAWFANDARGSFANSTPRPLPTQGVRTDRLVVADLDTDGDPDLLAINEVSFLEAPIRLLHNDGLGAFQAGTMVVGHVIAGLGAQALHDPVAVDFDGDGDQDIVDGLGLRRNDGYGGLTLVRAFAASHDFAIGDVDGDGDVDLLTRQYTGYLLQLNDGKGVCSPAAKDALPANRDGSGATAFDYDGDGDLDFAFIDRTYIWRNDGTGRFTAVTVFSAAAIADCLDMTPTDLDQDGDVDLILSIRPLNKPLDCDVAINDGKGGFTVKRLFSGLWYVKAKPLVADLDGDGDLDLLYGLYGSSVTRPMLFNQGQLKFTQGSFYVPGSDYVSQLILMDADDDGDLDIVGAHAVKPRLWGNDGRGNFQEQAAKIGDGAPPLAGGWSGVLAMDLDGDGDAEILHSGAVSRYNSRQSTFTYWNLTRHLRVPGVTRPGGTLRLEVSCHSPGRHQAISYASLRRLSTAMGELGTLRIDLSMAVPLPTVWVDGTTPTQALEVPVPPLASLRGLTLHLQTLLVGTQVPARLTGLVSESILR